MEFGKCLCGEIEYSFDRSKVISAHHCHCKDCQRATGSGKATIIIMSKKYFQVNQDPKFFEVQGEQGNHVVRGFCPNCGSGMFSYLKEHPNMVFVKAGTLNDSSWLKIDSNFFTDSSCDWNRPVEGIKNHNANPGLASNLMMAIKSLIK